MSDTPRTDAQYGFVTALRVAKERVEASPLYERFIDGTPLSNDIAAWIAQTYCEGAEFARQLERELAEAREQRDRLAEAAKAVVDRWETPFWKQVEHTGVYIAALRKAVEEVKGGPQ